MILFSSTNVNNIIYLSVTRQSSRDSPPPTSVMYISGLITAVKCSFFSATADEDTICRSRSFSMDCRVRGGRYMWKTLWKIAFPGVGLQRKRKALRGAGQTRHRTEGGSRLKGRRIVTAWSVEAAPAPGRPVVAAPPEKESRLSGFFTG